MGYKIDELKGVKEVLRGTLVVLEELMKRERGGKVEEAELAGTFGMLTSQVLRNYFMAKTQAEYQARRKEKRGQQG